MFFIEKLRGLAKKSSGWIKFKFFNVFANTHYWSVTRATFIHSTNPHHMYPRKYIPNFHASVCYIVLSLDVFLINLIRRILYSWMWRRVAW
jgi:hypothetical protein